MPMKWNGKDAMAKVVSELERRMGRAVIALQGEVIRSLGVSAGKDGRKGASLPGQPPRYRTGLLKQSIQVATKTEAGKIRGTVGSYGVAYARIMELGGSVPGGQPFIIVNTTPGRRARKFKTGARAGQRGMSVAQRRKLPGFQISPSARLVFLRRGATRFMGKTRPSSIAPRPYLRRAFSNNSEKVRQILFGRPIL